jgi:hypothetical protein
VERHEAGRLLGECLEEERHLRLDEGDNQTQSPMQSSKQSPMQSDALSFAIRCNQVRSDAIRRN